MNKTTALTNSNAPRNMGHAEQLQDRLRQLCELRTRLLAPTEGMKAGRWNAEELLVEGQRELQCLDAEEKAILCELAAMKADRLQRPSMRPRSVAATLCPPTVAAGDVQSLFAWAMAGVAAHVNDLRSAKPHQIEERNRAAICFSNFIVSAIAPLGAQFTYAGKSARVVIHNAGKALRGMVHGDGSVNERDLLLDDVGRLEAKIELLLRLNGVDTRPMLEEDGTQAAVSTYRTGIERKRAMRNAKNAFALKQLTEHAERHSTRGEA